MSQYDNSNEYYPHPYYSSSSSLSLSSSFRSHFKNAKHKKTTNVFDVS